MHPPPSALPRDGGAPCCLGQRQDQRDSLNLKATPVGHRQHSIKSGLARELPAFPPSFGFVFSKQAGMPRQGWNILENRDWNPTARLEARSLASREEAKRRQSLAPPAHFQCSAKETVPPSLKNQVGFPGDGALPRPGHPGAPGAPLFRGELGWGPEEPTQLQAPACQALGASGAVRKCLERGGGGPAGFPRRGRIRHVCVSHEFFVGLPAPSLPSDWHTSWLASDRVCTLPTAVTPALLPVCPWWDFWRIRAGRRRLLYLLADGPPLGSSGGSSDRRLFPSVCWSVDAQALPLGGGGGVPGTGCRTHAEPSRLAAVESARLL